MKAIYIFIFFIHFQFTSHSQIINKVKITDFTDLIQQSDSILIINFWATFCKPCVEEIPDLIQFASKYKKDKVSLYLISLDLADYYPTKIKKFVAAKKYTSNIAWLDETNADYFCSIISPEWSGSIPATLFVNKKKRLQKIL